MLLQLDQPILIKIKALQGKNKGKVVPVSTTLEEFLDDGLSMTLIDLGVFDVICHSSDYYDVISVEYKEAGNE